MTGSNLTLSPTLLTVVASLLALSSVLIWWVVRKKRQRVWLPTLRLIKGDSKPLPKIKLLPPPLFLFLCFILSALTLVWISSRPSERQYRDISSGVSKVHLYVDLSPSTESSHVFKEMDARQTFFRKLFNHYSEQGSITVTSTANPDILEFKDLGEFLAWSETLRVHRSGAKLGEGINYTLERLGQIDRLVIVSDRDKFSWSDFNWRYLETKLEVLLAPYPNTDEVRNIFIDGVELLSAEGQNQSVWKLSIARNYSQGTVRGLVNASFHGETLQSGSFSIPNGDRSVDIELQWPRSRWNKNLGAEESIKWRIQTESPNVLKQDDTFREYIKGVQQDLLIVSEPKGEMFLEDPVHHLKISLDVLGFRARRQDTYQFEEGLNALPLWVIVAGNGPMASFCPLDYEGRRIENLNVIGKNAQPKKLPVIWLMPQDRNVSYKNMCWCYSKLVEGLSIQEKMPTYCEDLESRDQYISVLQSTGAMQVGGTIDDVTGAIAWNRKQKDSGAEVFAFTLPLKPSKAVGISYDMLPTLTKSFLELSHIIDDQGRRKSLDWPRLSHNITPEILSNVPREESVLARLSLSELPRVWTESDKLNLISSHGVREEDDPRLWIELAFWVLAGLCLLEGAWVIVKYIRGGAVKGFLLFLLAIALPDGNGALANVKLVLAGYGDQNLRGELLSRDVSGRTSIMLDEEVKVIPSIKDEDLEEPWLWVRDGQTIKSLGLDGRAKMERWIKRGGFLVMENQNNPDALQSFVNLSGGVWKPIPPDHEIMRSFHLLDSLPKCASHVWQGFHYDNRIAVVAIPFGFIEGLLQSKQEDQCSRTVGRERATRIFINILMVALATDYKKDQIHLPEILKRLR